MQLTTETFIKSIEDIELEVLLDNGIYRHLKFKSPSSTIVDFEVCTYPDHLVFSGDHGCFTFKEKGDLFDFFRRDVVLSGTPSIPTHDDYWTSKVISESTIVGGIHETNTNVISATLEQFVESAISDGLTFWESTDQGNYDDYDDFISSVKDELEDAISSVDVNSFDWLNLIEFESEIVSGLKPFSEISYDCGKELTPQFQYCCKAIVWGIHAFEEKKGASIE
ncbi:hypothetical protein QTV49_003892 [Vibrio vulnificus]|nr:hypothetical protein [Vibrio vulnificus]